MASWHPMKSTPSSAPRVSLTLRSSGAPTSGCQARRPQWFILRPSGLASCRCRPLSSNVRLHKSQSLRLATAQLPFSMQMQFIAFVRSWESSWIGTTGAVEADRRRTNRSASRRTVLAVFCLVEKGQFVDPPPLMRCAQVLYSAAAAVIHSTPRLTNVSLVFQQSSWHRGIP